MLRLTGRAIDRPSRDQCVKFVRGLRAALVLQAIVRPDEADCFRRTNSPSPCKLSINAVDECVQPIVYFFLMLVVDR
jgi:hypothetical protein